MITSQDVSSATSPVPRGVRRALDAMRSQCRPQLALDGTRCHRRYFRPNLAAPVPHLCRQDPARRASRDRARMRPPRTAAGDARRQNHGRRAAVRLSALRPVFDRVSPPLRRDAVADAEAAGGVHGHARRDALAVWIGAGPARGRIRADRGGDGKSGDRGRYRRRSRRRTDPRRDFGRIQPADGPLSLDRCDAGIRLAHAPHLPADRHRNRPPALGASRRRRVARRNRNRRTSRDQDCRGAAAMPAGRRDRSRLAKTGELPRRARSGAARHAGRIVARCRRQCPRARTARSRAGAGSRPSAGDRACGLGACSARRLSFHACATRKSAPEASSWCTKRGRCATMPRCWPFSAMH